MSRTLFVEECVLAAAVIVSGAAYLYACLPRPSLSATVARSMAKLKSPFARGSTFDPPVALVPASRAMVDAIRRAEKLEARGRFDGVTRRAWRQAADEVHRFGLMRIATGSGSHVRLFMKDAEEGRMAEIGAYLEQLMPGQFAALEARRREFVDEDVDKRASVPEVNWFMVAAAAPEDVRDTALDLAALHADASRNVRLIAKYRELVGYDYWRAVCDAGASEPGFQARAALWRAEYDARQARFDLARATYEEGFAAWREACRAIPALATDPRVAERIDEHMQGYRGVLTALEARAAALDESDGRIDL